MVGLAGGLRGDALVPLLLVLGVLAVSAALVVFRVHPWVPLAILGVAVLAAASRPDAGVDPPFLGVFGYAAAVQLRLRTATVVILAAAGLVGLLAWLAANASKFASIVDGLVLVVALDGHRMQLSHRLR